MEQRRVLVTGSSRGIGKAIASKLAENGWQVALHATRPSDAMEEVRGRLGKAVKGVYYADLSSPDRAAELFGRALHDGPVHALVNNAGVYMPIDFAKAGDASFRANLHKTFAVNFESPVQLMRAACAAYEGQGGGKILNVASRVGFRGEAGSALYAASKAALINVTRSLAVELAPKNVGVFGIAPGWVDTAMVREGMEERLPEILASIPLGRMATPGDCGAVAAFLLSDEAAYLSGVVIDINGASYFH
jgi:3-oxoacyl-[acyl-carrier protein] reductase